MKQVKYRGKRATRKQRRCIAQKGYGAYMFKKWKDRFAKWQASFVPDSVRNIPLSVRLRPDGEFHKFEKMQDNKKQHNYTYVQGPMLYLGQHIVRLMQDAGCPAKILYCYRSPEEQERLYSKGRTVAGRIVTKAKPFDSPHQFYEAVDIIHPSLGWDVSEEYWQTLNACVREVERKFGVSLSHGMEWKFRDAAHIELANWKAFRAWIGKREPLPSELWVRFKSVLPKVARDYEKTHGGPPMGVRRASDMEGAINSLK